MKYGIKICSSAEVNNDIGLCHTMIRKKQHKLGNFVVIPFSVPHGDTECDMFLIWHKETGWMMFITDAEYCPYKFTGIDFSHVLIECNYSEEYLEKDSVVFDHVLSGHMEEKTCKRLVESINNQSLRSVGLIHISNTNGHSERFQRIISKVVDADVNVWIATKGKEVELKNTPF